MGAAARPGMGCKRCPLQRRVARQKKKLILERGCVLGFLEGEVQIDIVVSKKRPQGVSPTANPAQRVAVGKEEQSGFCSDVSLRYKIDTRYKRERKGKIKKRAGTDVHNDTLANPHEIKVFGSRRIYFTEKI